MSFKIKKWALWRTVNLTDYIPGLKNYMTPGQGGINTKSYAYPWQDRILCLCYTADDVPVYVLYDPVTDSAEGPFEGDGQAWSFHSYFYGDSCYYGYWGKDYFMGRPGGAMGYGSPHWRTWDASYNFWSCDLANAAARWQGPERPLSFHGDGDYRQCTDGHGLQLRAESDRVRVGCFHTWRRLRGPKDARAGRSWLLHPVLRRVQLHPAAVGRLLPGRDHEGDKRRQPRHQSSLELHPALEQLRGLPGHRRVGQRLSAPPIPWA